MPLFLAAAMAACVLHAVHAITPDDILPYMTVAQKIGQMTQLDIGMILTNGQVDMQKLNTAVNTYAVGSIINTPYTGGCPGSAPQGMTVTTWRNLLSTVQTMVLNQTQPNLPVKIPLLWGIDSVHGANYIANATLFPHATGMAATFDPANYYTVGQVAALDTRTSGIPWMFSPVLGLGMQPLWSRLYETLGEDPFLAAAFAEAYITGAKSASNVAGLNYTTAVACMKHYMGYSNPRSGKDRTDAWIPDAYLKQYFQPSFAAAVAAGVESAMVNSGSVNGVPAHASAALINGILRTELNWTGMAVTDWQDIEKLQFYHNVAATPSLAIELALNAGIDMSMVPSDFSFPQVLAELVQNNTIPESRLDQSVRRILQLKIDVGLFENAITPPQLMSRILGNPADQQKSLDIARQSITLLQNVAVAGTSGKPVLPLSTWVECGGSILVVGPAMDSLADQCGGWSLQWGGATSCQFQAGIGMTVLQGITLQASSRGIASQGYQGVTFTTANQSNLTAVAELAAQATVVVMVIGEAPESETPGDTADLTISPSQAALFQAVNVTGKPIVTVLIEPRPRVLGPIADGSAAIVMAYLPCLHGGQAIAEVLFGEINPSGRLPLTYPRTTGDLDVYFHKPWNASYEGLPESTYHNPLFSFGSGFGYSPLNYSNLQLSPTVASSNQPVLVTVNISNLGQYDANETVLVFVRQLYRPAISPENLLLKGFTKVFIPAGQSAVASVTLNTASFAYWTPTLESVVDAGNYAITVDSLSAQLVIDSPAQTVQESASSLNLPSRLKGREIEQLVDEMMQELDEADIRASGPISRETTFADLRARVRRVLTRV